MPERPNWFVALPIEGSWFAAIPDPPSGFRRFDPLDLHLTIAFMGPVSETQAMRGFDALDWPLGPVEARLGEVVPMGPPARYSALSALLSDSREIVEAAMGASREAIHSASESAPDKRPPKAHITLARPQRSCRDRAAGLTWARALDVTHVCVRLDRVALYTWNEDRKSRLFAIRRSRYL